MRPYRFSLFCLSAILFGASSAHALTINGNFIDSGQNFPGSIITAGGAPGNTAGGGNIQAIFQAAAGVWQNIITDDYTVTINYGWSTLGSTTLSTTATYSSGTPERIYTTTLQVNDTGAIPIFLDSTPSSSSEWTTITNSTADLGGGAMNTGRVYSNATDPAAANNYDLFTAMLHEMGHALGFSATFGPYESDAVDDDIDITAPLPYAGAAIPTPGPSEPYISTALPNALMVENLPLGIRKMPSDADILAVAQLSQFRQLNLSSVPEPATSLLLVAGMIGIISRGSRKLGRAKS